MTRNDNHDGSKDPDEFPGWTNLTGGDVARRSVMKGAAWSVPVIALTVATPLAAASPVPNMDISVTTLNTSTGLAFAEAPVGVQSGQNAWNDNQVLHDYIQIQNTGTDIIPAGAIFTVTYPATSNGLQSFSNPTISTLSGNTVPGATTSTVTPVGAATVSNGAVTRSFTVAVPIPPGTGFTAQLAATVATLPLGNYLNNTIKGSAQLPAGGTDANPANNAATGAVFAFRGRQAIAKAKGGGTWNSGNSSTVLQILAPVDVSACVGTPAGVVRSFIAQFTGGTVTQNIGSVQYGNSVAQTGGPAPAFFGQFNLTNRPSGALTRLTIVMEWTSGCGVGTQTFTWAASPLVGTTIGTLAP